MARLKINKMAGSKNTNVKPSKTIDKGKPSSSARYSKAEKGLIARAVLFLLHKQRGQEEEPKGWSPKRWEMVKNLIGSQRTVKAVMQKFGKWLREDKLEDSVWWKACKQAAVTQHYHEVEFNDVYAKMAKKSTSINPADPTGSERASHQQPIAKQQSIKTSAEQAQPRGHSALLNPNGGDNMSKVNENAPSKAGASTNAAGKQQQMQGGKRGAWQLATLAVGVQKSKSSAESIQHLAKMASNGNGNHKHKMVEAENPTGTGQMQVLTHDEVEPGQSGSSKKLHQQLSNLVKNIGPGLQSSSKTALNGGYPPSNLPTRQPLVKDSNAGELHLQQTSQMPSALGMGGEGSDATTIHLHNCSITIIEKVFLTSSADHPQH